MEALIIIKVLAIIPEGGKIVGGLLLFLQEPKRQFLPEESGDLIAARSAFPWWRHRQSPNLCLFFDFGWFEGRINHLCLSCRTDSSKEMSSWKRPASCGKAFRNLKVMMLDALLFPLIICRKAMMDHYALRDKDSCFHKDHYISGPTEGDLAVWSSPRGSWDSREGKCNNSATRIDWQLQSEKQDQAHLKRLRFQTPQGRSSITELPLCRKYEQQYRNPNNIQIVSDNSKLEDISRHECQCNVVLRLNAHSRLRSLHSRRTLVVLAQCLDCPMEQFFEQHNWKDPQALTFHSRRQAKLTSHMGLKTRVTVQLWVWQYFVELRGTEAGNNIGRSHVRKHRQGHWVTPLTCRSSQLLLLGHEKAAVDCQFQH